MTINSWIIEIPLIPPSRNSKEARSTWLYREIKNEWRETVRLLCLERKIPELGRVKTEPAIYFREARRRDHDNYGIVNKLVHDGLVSAGIIADDSPKYLAKPSYPDLLVDPENPRTVVKITALI